MVRTLLLLCLPLWAPAAAFGQGAAEAPADRPNLILIVSDDAGYGDFSLHGCADFATPRIDSIAEAGVRFRQAYVAASVCSPSRAAIMTGRYPQRFGHEFNIPPRWSETNGLPLTETLLPEILQRNGYRTVGLGKWHLGYAKAFQPMQRGFDAYFGFLQGARSYWPLKKSTRLNRLRRDHESIPEEFTYMTDALGKEAAAYVAENRDRPFFLYLAFNAVHTPMHATEEDLAGFSGIDHEKRRKLAAMTRAMDRAVGVVLDALEENGIRDHTLLCFVNDNGGATNNASQNGVLRGTKGTPFEGGIRVPMLMQWPARLPRGTIYDLPVSGLDLLPTFLAAGGIVRQSPLPLDGVDLLPYLRSKKAGRPHPQLFWRRGDNAAVRLKDWKLVRYKAGPWMLFDLASDPQEERNLVDQQKERVVSMQAMLEAFETTLEAPRWRFGKKAAEKSEKPASSGGGG